MDPTDLPRSQASPPVPKRPPADAATPRPGSAREHARTTIRKLLALSELGAPAESVTAQDVVGAVAELLAAAAQVGAMPTCFLSAVMPEGSE